MQHDSRRNVRVELLVLGNGQHFSSRRESSKNDVTFKLFQNLSVALTKRI